MQAPGDFAVTFSTVAHSIELGILALVGFLARQAWNDIRRTVHSAQQSVARIEEKFDQSINRIEEKVNNFSLEALERIARLEEGQKYYNQLRKRS